MVYGYIDENNNGILEKNFIGIPKEAFLFVSKLYGAPKFNQIKSNIGGEQKNIKLILQ